MNEIATWMVSVGESVDLSRKDAILAARAVLRFFGGQKVYFPMAGNTDESKNAEALDGVITDELGGAVAQRYVPAFLKVFGGGQTYFPLERSAFRDEIADQVYERFDGTPGVVNELCREFGTTFVQIYRLYHHGLDRSRASRERTLFDQ